MIFPYFLSQHLLTFRRNQTISTQTLGRLIISKEKYKFMCVNSGTPRSINIDGQPPEHYIEEFTYPGSVISIDDSAQKDIKVRINKGRCTFSILRNIWKSKEQVRIYTSNVKSVLLYVSECWRILKRENVKCLSQWSSAKDLQHLLQYLSQDHLWHPHLYSKSPSSEESDSSSLSSTLCHSQANNIAGCRYFRWFQDKPRPTEVYLRLSSTRNTYWSSLMVWIGKSTWQARRNSLQSYIAPFRPLLSMNAVFQRCLNMTLLFWKQNLAY